MTIVIFAIIAALACVAALVSYGVWKTSDNVVGAGTRIAIMLLVSQVFLALQAPLLAAADGVATNRFVGVGMVLPPILVFAGFFTLVMHLSFKTNESAPVRTMMSKPFLGAVVLYILALVVVISMAVVPSASRDPQMVNGLGIAINILMFLPAVLVTFLLGPTALKSFKIARDGRRLPLALVIVALGLGVLAFIVAVLEVFVGLPPSIKYVVQALSIVALCGYLITERKQDATEYPPGSDVPGTEAIGVGEEPGGAAQ